MSASTLFDILEERDDFLAVNKPGGLVCHPTKGDAYSSLIGRLRLYYRDRPEIKPSFVNRLDRETSGVVLIAKHPMAHKALQKLFDQRRVFKRYLAVVEGIPSADYGTIHRPIGRELGSQVTIKQTVLSEGAPSITHWRKLAEGGETSLLEIKPETGRLHQIRVHLAFLGHPVVGDKLYGPDPSFYLEFAKNGWKSEMKEKLRTQRQMLHAVELKIPKDDENETARSWTAAVPEDMLRFLEERGMSLP